MVSEAYPSLERKPGGPDNWVERAGGLPDFIERIAKRLHYEKGMTISHAIATAVNTVRRWAVGGKVAKYGDPNHKRVSPQTIAKAQKAWAEWNAKRAAGKLNLSEVEFYMIDLADSQVHGTSADSTGSATLSNMNLLDLAERAGKIEDPVARAAARASILDLSSSIPPKKAQNGKASDGRPSYKRQGKWGHGFVPLDKAAKEAKAKGSPIAMKRMNRLFGSVKKKVATVQKASEPTGRAGSRSGLGRKKDDRTVRVQEKNNPVAEKANDIAFLRHSASAQGTNKKDSALPRDNVEASKKARTSARVNQNWDEIPESLKTVRNGKRYVLAEFGGKGYLTEWVGGVKDGTPGDLANRKVMSSITRADALKMTPAQLRAMLNNPKTPANVKTILRKALQKQTGSTR